MREITAEQITETIARLCVEANLRLPGALRCRLEQAAAEETAPLAREIMDDIVENFRAAADMRLPICQDTGMAVVFAELGQDAHVTGGGFEEAIHAGVAKGYTEGYLRCSIVADPLRRVNTGDNTPAVIHLRLVPGDQLRLTVCPKGFGSENMSRLKMLTPAAGEDDVAAFVTETARLAGSNPCPPMVLGVGLGGNFERCAALAKRALRREVGNHHPDPFYAALENRLLEEVNALNIGPQGFGGRTTALWVAIETAPTHIAGLPAAVNVGCYVNRHAQALL
ncbi:MAG: fumarate hydratase [Oscillospiraceae bacterium]|jgi:fumarate hydratase subunit alpha|nr:fumarate hydratase [Oscillospiraceae bacterium]